MPTPLLELRHVTKRYPAQNAWWSRQRSFVHAVTDFSLAVAPGETVGLVGESGCGKSTLGQLVLRLMDVNSGQIFFDGQDITRWSQSRLRPLRRRMQIVFQDPYASLNPRMTVREIVEEPLLVHRIGNATEREARASELIQTVGLDVSALQRYPHEFSGGQRQRVGVARALALSPELIVADEPVSALDVSIRGDIINVLMDVQRKMNLAMLFISHDLNVVAHVSHRIAVMYLGRIMELVPATRLLQARHPYTLALVSAVPRPQPGRKRQRIPLQGDVPSPLHPPSGCPFHPRCPYAQPVCAQQLPVLEEYAPGQFSACHFTAQMPSVAEVSCLSNGGAA